MVYLDHAATSFPTKYFAKDFPIYGNANSPHSLGIQANQALEEARNRIKEALGVESGKVLFCRCATEAVEWLCKKLPSQRASFCSYIEHDSVGQSAEYFLPCESFKKMNWLHDDLVLHQYVNQLTGTVFPIESIGKQVQSTGAFFGSDFTAAIGHYPLPNNFESFCDAVWFSGHKFGCEQGIGAIWLSDRLFKYLGGSEDSRNEYGLIHGTPNVSAAVAMSYAMEHAIEEVWVMEAKTQNLVFYLQRMLNKNNIEYHVVCDDQPKTYAINALYLPKFNADALVNFLSSKGIYISPGHSACSNDAVEASRVLEAFGLTKQEASQTVRVSFGLNTSQEDINALSNGIIEFKRLFI